MSRNDSIDNSRRFDWGPPANPVSERFGEWTLYIVLIALIGLLGWFLIAASVTTGGSTEVAASSESDSGASQPPDEKNEVKKIFSGTREEPEAKSAPTFMVQLGAFGDKDSAEAYCRKISEMGFSVKIALPDTQYEMFRLLAGPFKSEKEAETFARKLNELEIPSFVIESL